MTAPALDLPDTTHRRVEAAGLGFHVAERGPGGADPLVLLHGWPQDGRMWRKVLPALSERFRCILPDLRGLGRSDAPEGSYRKQVLADDVLAVLDALGVERFRLAGHDWGGWVAQLVATQHPERVERLMVLDIPPLWEERSLDPRRLAGAVHVPVLAALGDRFADRIADGILRTAKGIAPDERAAYVAMIGEPERRRASAGYYRAALTRDIPDALRRPLARPPMPVVCMGGKGDPVVRFSKEVELVEGAGHFLPEDRPQAVLDRALAFL
jgi:pimeloyl-ACP methyl ester carboxylesterase